MTFNTVWPVVTFVAGAALVRVEAHLERRAVRARRRADAQRETVLELQDLLPTMSRTSVQEAIVTAKAMRARERTDVPEALEANAVRSRIRVLTTRLDDEQLRQQLRGATVQAGELGGFPLVHGRLASADEILKLDAVVTELVDRLGPIARELL